MRNPNMLVLVLVLVTLSAPAAAQTKDLQEESKALELYALHCSPCHGARARGDGPAGRFLDPRPRDFTKGQFRVVSTENGVPSRGNLRQVINHGMPGTAMVSFSHLGNENVNLLIEAVRIFHRRGLEELYKPEAASPEELREWIEKDTTPGPAVSEGERPREDAASLARGRLHFQRLCAPCHGPEGRADVTPPVTDPDEPPMFPRDLSHGVLKGGIEDSDLFARIRCGMPGSPMPSVPPETLDDRGVWDIIHFLRTIIPENAQKLHEIRSGWIQVPRIEGALPTEFEDPRFARAEPAHLALAPFRAQEDTVRGVWVRAVHDGEHVIFRVEYADPTRDVPTAKKDVPPDGLACRVTNYEVPPVMPTPGLPLPLDRAIWLAGTMPDEKDPIFDGVEPRFVNPDSVCKSPIGPEHIGRGNWRDRIWTVILPVKPERAGRVIPGGRMGVSFAAFDGSLKRGPLPVAFTAWQTLIFE